MLPLFIKPTGQIELAFETGLMFCFRYGVGDGELQASFRVIDFNLSSRSPFFVISVQPDTKRAFHGRHTKFFGVATDKSIIETKTDLRNIP